MAHLDAKNLKFGQNFPIQCILGSFSSFQTLVCKFWLSRFAENIQFIVIFDTRAVNRPVFYGNLKCKSIRDWQTFSDSMYPC